MTTPGTLYNYGPFPYAVFADTDLIVGQMVEVDPDSPTFALLNEVECRSGYEPVQITVNDLDGYAYEALSYGADDYTKITLLPFLPVIPSGDWNALLTR